jgi:CheY-like chemotaxis protein
MEPFSALLLCADPVALGTVQKVLKEYDFNVTTAATALAADQAMRSARFDLAVYDNDIPGALQLADRKACANPPKMVFAIMPSAATAETQGKRIHFILQKPVAADLFGRSLRAAFSVMLKERRAAFRHPVQIIPSSCLLQNADREEKLTNAIILNISQTGLCFQASELLTSDAIVRIKFELPETQETVQMTGTVAWVRASGRTGMKFTDVAPEQQTKLNEWLDTKIARGPEALLGAMSYPARYGAAHAE